MTIQRWKELLGPGRAPTLRARSLDDARACVAAAQRHFYDRVECRACSGPVLWASDAHGFVERGTCSRCDSVVWQRGEVVKPA